MGIFWWWCDEVGLLLALPVAWSSGHIVSSTILFNPSLPEGCQLRGISPGQGNLKGKDQHEHQNSTSFTSTIIFSIDVLIEFWYASFDRIVVSGLQHQSQKAWR